MNEKKEEAAVGSRSVGSRVLRIVAGLAIPVMACAAIVIFVFLPPFGSPDKCPDPQERFRKGSDLAARTFFVRANRRAAFAWMKSASDSGSCPEADHALGVILAVPGKAEPYGVAPDTETGLRLLERAAANGHSESAGMMALRYSGTVADWLGWPAPDGGTNWEKAVAFAETAEKDGDSNGLFVLGLAFRFGRGREVDMEKAAHCFRRAAEKGDKPAEESLRDVERMLAEPKPAVSVTGRQGYLGGMVLQFHNRSTALLVGTLSMEDAGGGRRKVRDLAIKPNEKEEIGRLELDRPLKAGDRGSVVFDGHVWRLHFELLSNARFKTWFECGK